MPKILRDTELLDVVRRIVEEGAIEDEGHYLLFLEDVTAVVCGYLGGIPGMARNDEDLGLGRTIAVHHDCRVPDDGGIFAKYDTDIQWRGGKEAA